ncbi:PEGA domain-containing protein [Candidatus Dojkabacteria bacterium]|nr:PEGA domain-containing protein [Candidatus Dojkabacteria bacterium]
MDNLENELKNINSIELKTPDSKFKENLRKRIVNEYESILLTKKLRDDRSSLSLFDKSYILISKIFLMFKYQSALNLAGIFLFVFSFTAIASYMALPDGIKNTIFHRKGQVDISANVEGVDVYINGDYVGLTPLEDRKLEPGNYTIRMEKDGYKIFSDTFTIKEGEESSVYAELLIQSEYDQIYADWLDYENSELNFQFKYPSNWSIVERVAETPEKDFQVRISKDDNYISFVFNPETNKFELDSSQDVSSYKRSLNLAEGIESNRFLQFSNTGEFLKGGFIISQSEQHPTISVLYDIKGNESEILESDVLKTMDHIAQSLTVGEYEPIMAFNEEGWNEKINIDEFISKEDIKKPQPTKKKEEEQKEVVLAETYTNDLYGYQIKYPSNWSVSTSRAYYPLEDRALAINVNGIDYDVARLKLKSGDDGRVYVLTTTEDISYFGADLNLCSNYSSLQVTAEFSGYKLISNSSGKYNHQLCVARSGVFTHTSAQNGNIKYAIYWEIDDSYITEDLLAEFKEVVNSLNFDENLSNQIIDDIEYSYTNDDIGFSIKYPYKWTLRENEIICGDATCEKVNIANDSGYTLVEFSDYISDISDEDFIIVDKNVNTASGQMQFKQYYEKICSGEECSQGSFQFGLYQEENFQVKYEVDINSSVQLINLLTTFEKY